MSKSNSQVTTLGDNQTEAADQSQADAGDQSSKSKAKPNVVKGANADAQLSGKRRTITIHPTEGEGGSDAVFLSINGYAYQIPRGEPQSVPEEVVEVIKNAKTTVMTFGEGGKVVSREAQRYAFSLE